MRMSFAGLALLFTATGALEGQIGFAPSPPAALPPIPAAAPHGTPPLPRIAVSPWLAEVPPLPRSQQGGPADSVYRIAREALNRNEYGRAAEFFNTLRRRYPRSDYAADAYYWEGYARYRIGSLESLKAGLALLDEQARSRPEAPTRKGGDAASLETRILGELARLGDSNAARRLALAAEGAGGPPTPPTAIAPPTPPFPADVPSPPSSRLGRDSRCSDEDDLQVSALNAVMQMNSERAIPILEKVLARRDEGSACLRRRAVFIVSQHRGERVEQMLLDAVRNDPDPEVRSQAVFWLSQVNSATATAALESVLATSQDPKLQERAIFALSQQNRPEARQALRNYAGRNDADEALRDKAVFWLGQSNRAEDVAFLQDLYGRVQGARLKERIIFSVSQNTRSGSEWFGRIARNQSEPLELRKKALFWMGQRSGTTGAELAAVYDSFTDREMKDQLIFVLSQKKDRAAVDKLVDIVQKEPDKELKKKALFWLSQSEDPRVADILARILVP
jgi:TolA-binding protein